MIYNATGYAHFNRGLNGLTNSMGMKREESIMETIKGYIDGKLIQRKTTCISTVVSNE